MLQKLVYITNVVLIPSYIKIIEDYSIRNNNTIINNHNLIRYA